MYGITDAARGAIPTDLFAGSRRLLTYRRLADADVNADELTARIAARLALDEVDRTSSASDLNAFRKKYFAGFK